MALSSIYVQSLTKFPSFFKQIKEAQAPELFTQQLLKDWNFTSSNDRSFIPLLKALGFLSQDGRPTQRYHDYRDPSKARKVLGQGIREAYGDIFLIKADPKEADREAIRGKFKSTHNTSDNVAGLMASTFLKLLELADISEAAHQPEHASQPEEIRATEEKQSPKRQIIDVHGLHYNIQIHLPPTKDIEIYNAIFKSMKEHLLES